MMCYWLFLMIKAQTHHSLKLIHMYNWIRLKKSVWLSFIEIKNLAIFLCDYDFPSFFMLTYKKFIGFDSLNLQDMHSVICSLKYIQPILNCRIYQTNMILYWISCLL